ncbi:MAG: hypothetical protein AAFO69_13400, partial [Bacteroidota bacterium]
KAKGMFATLIINLPSVHTGGTLLVRFDGKEVAYESAEASDLPAHPLTYSAFYADCEHEITPVTSGRRVCLVYNLCFEDRGEQTDSSILPKFSDHVSRMSYVLANYRLDQKYKVIMLDHQYTPSNFSVSQLKGADKQRYEVMKAVCEPQGLVTKLALLTHYQTGDLQGVGYDYYDDEEPGEGIMGEVYDEYSMIEHWAVGDELPDIGHLQVDSDHVIGEKDYEKLQPIEQEEERYTGNYGMTMQYWYHFAAIVFWSQEDHIDIISGTNTRQRLDWLAYYLAAENTSSAEEQTKYLEELLIAVLDHMEDNRLREEVDGAALIGAARKTGRVDLLKVRPMVIAKLFTSVKIEVLHQYFSEITVEDVLAVVSKVMFEEDAKALLYLLRLLAHSGQWTNKEGWIRKVWEQLPAVLDQTNFHQDHEATEQSLLLLFELTHRHPEATDQYLEAQILESIETNFSRVLVNQCLIPLILNHQLPENPLCEGFQDAVIGDLQKRVKNEPQEPADWKMKVPDNKLFQTDYVELAHFLQSPVDTIYYYKHNASLRGRMESVISQLKLDLTRETIKKSSPHTLQLTKNRNSFELSKKHWQEDCELLGWVGEKVK